MRIARVFVAFVALAIAVTPAWSQNTPRQLEKVRFGISPYQDTLMPLVGKKMGWYEEVGLDVEFVILGWEEIQEALASRSSKGVDVAISNETNTIAAFNRNPSVRYYYGINTFDNGFALMGRAGGPIQPLSHFLQMGLSRPEAVKRTASQLRGKKVVTTGNTDMEQGVAAAASRGGLDFSRDIHIINLPPDEGLLAFLTGTGDAYLGGIPQRTRAKKEGMIEILTGLDLGPAPINGFTTTASYIQTHNDRLLRLLHVWFRIVNYTNANPDEVGAYIVGEMNRNSSGNFTVGDFKAFWNQLEHYPASPEEIQAEILSPDGPNYWRKRWDDSNTYLVEVVKRIPRRVSAEDAFYMERAHELYVRVYAK